MLLRKCGVLAAMLGLVFAFSTQAIAQDATLTVYYNGGASSVSLSEPGCDRRVVYCVNNLLSSASSRLPPGYVISSIAYSGPMPASQQAAVYNSEILTSLSCDVGSILTSAAQARTVADISQLQLVFDRSYPCN